MSTTTSSTPGAPAAFYELDTTHVSGEHEVAFVGAMVRENTSAQLPYDEVENLARDPYTALARERLYPLEVILDDADQRYYEQLGLPAQDWCHGCDAPSDIAGVHDEIESVTVGDELFSRVLAVVDLACGHTATEQH